MSALIILQLIFLLPFAIHFAFLLSNSLTGQMYRLNKLSYYLGIVLLIITLFALLVPSSGVLSFVVFIDYFYFLYLIFFRSARIKARKNPLVVLSKILLLLTPIAIILILNVYFMQQFSFTNYEVLNSATTNTDMKNFVPTQNQGISVVPLATLLMLSSSVLQLISLTVDILLDKIAMNKYANK